MFSTKQLYYELEISIPYLVVEGAITYKVAEVFFFLFPIHLSVNFLSHESCLDVRLPSQIYRQMYGKLEKLTGRLLDKLHPANLVNAIFYLVF